VREFLKENKELANEIEQLCAVPARSKA
jgi:hypothetical protein